MERPSEGQEVGTLRHEPVLEETAASKCGRKPLVGKHRSKDGMKKGTYISNIYLVSCGGAQKITTITLYDECHVLTVLHMERAFLSPCWDVPLHFRTCTCLELCIPFCKTI